MDDTLTLITGASSGIGRALAIRLSSERRLILHGRDIGRLEETMQMCDTRHVHAIWQHDLAQVEAIETSLQTFLQSGAYCVDTFVHCAGIVKVLPMRTFDHASVQALMKVNVFSAMEIVRLLLKKKLNRGLKQIVFLSSIYSIRGTKGHSVYAATKGALDAYMRALAIELAPDIRVNTILAGGVKTPMSAAAFDNPTFVEQMKAEYPLGIGEVSDIVDAAEYLLSHKARWITGQAIVVDGGRTVH